jgi:hypothetical protein
VSLFLNARDEAPKRDPTRTNHKNDQACKKQLPHQATPILYRRVRYTDRPVPHRVNSVWRRRQGGFDRADAAAASLELPPAVFKTCPWQPRALIETGLRQWLRCCAPALRDHQVLGMPSRAVDEAWHGLILCTARYSAFCTKAYGAFLHHHPEGGAPDHVAGTGDPMGEQLRRTVVAWSLVAKPGEECVLWDLDERVGVDQPWGLDPARIAAIETALAEINRPDRLRRNRLST